MAFQLSGSDSFNSVGVPRHPLPGGTVAFWSRLIYTTNIIHGCIETFDADGNRAWDVHAVNGGFGLSLPGGAKVWAPWWPNWYDNDMSWFLVIVRHEPSGSTDRLSLEVRKVGQTSASTRGYIDINSYTPGKMEYAHIPRAPLGDLGVWDKVLTNAEVSQIVTGRPFDAIPSAPVHYWRFWNPDQVEPDRIGSVPLVSEGAATAYTHPYSIPTIPYIELDEDNQNSLELNAVYLPGGVSQYYFEYREATGTAWTTESSSTGAHEITGLDPDTEYTVKVYILDGSYKIYSNIETFSTDPLVDVRDLTAAINRFAGEVTLSWWSEDTYDGYIVERQQRFDEGDLA